VGIDELEEGNFVGTNEKRKEPSVRKPANSLCRSNTRVYPLSMH